MAQRRGNGRGGALARRLGLGGTRAVALACLALVVACGVWGYLSARAGSGLTIERSEGTAQAEATGTGGGDVTGDADAGGEAGEEEQGETPAPSRVLVHVDGAVASPGVYALLTDDPRVEDAVEAAGGLAEGADTTSLNLAAPVADGAKVHVPAQGEDAQQGGATAGSVAASGTAGATGATDSSGAGGLVNINTADAAALTTLPGVGEATAAAIVQDREQNGPFASAEDLMRVSGIGEKKFAKVRDLICV